MESWRKDLEVDLDANAWSDTFESVKKIFTFIPWSGGILASDEQQGVH